MRGRLLPFTDSSGAIKSVTIAYLATHRAYIAHRRVIGGTPAVPAAQETSFRNLLN